MVHNTNQKPQHPARSVKEGFQQVAVRSSPPKHVSWEQGWFMHAHTLGAQRVTKRQRYFRFAHNVFLTVTTIWGNFGDACFGVDVVSPNSAVSQH